MDDYLPAVLLMGGGEGMGPIEATARALGNALYDERIGEPIGQILVICGHNKKLASRLLTYDWKIPVQVFNSLEIWQLLQHGFPITILALKRSRKFSLMSVEAFKLTSTLSSSKNPGHLQRIVRNKNINLF